jgi:adenine deaminase
MARMRRVDGWAGSAEEGLTPRSPAVVSGNLVDVITGITYPATLELAEGRIRRIRRDPAPHAHFLLPGFVDSHVHVESSMVTPSEFARQAVRHGTVAAVSDPHEIANVLGIDGVLYMLADARNVPFQFCFGAPSCVPATEFETSGARLGPDEVEQLLARADIGYLSEMMNYPGVLGGDPGILAKLASARRHGKPVDGHAPGLRGEDLQRYIDAGISTDHECDTYDEALEKMERGMMIQIREGTATRDFDALAPLMAEFPDRCMLCSDDKHPADLVAGHIDALVRRGLARGLDFMTLLRCATLNPVRHYRLPVGLLQEGDRADFIVVDNLSDIRVLETYLAGDLVARGGKSLLQPPPATIPNRFQAAPTRPEDFAVPAGAGRLLVIDVTDGQVVTGRIELEPLLTPSAKPASAAAGSGAEAAARSEGRFAVADPTRDLLKIAVVDRYGGRGRPAVGFIRGFGLRAGALASSVAHDSHNIVAVGVTDEDLSAAVNAVIETRGGQAVAAGPTRAVLPLPVAGLMSTAPAEQVARRYAALGRMARDLGSPLAAPFMTLSFMALLVIPHLKMSDRGLFDGDRFALAQLFEG